MLSDNQLITFKQQLTGTAHHANKNKSADTFLHTQNTYHCREVSDICTLQSLNTSTNEHSNTETDWLKHQPIASARI